MIADKEVKKAGFTAFGFTSVLAISRCRLISEVIYSGSRNGHSLLLGRRVRLWDFCTSPAMTFWRWRDNYGSICIVYSGKASRASWYFLPDIKKLGKSSYQPNITQIPFI